ncbi:sensor histidine kinase [Nocardioides baculatus]|uniref:histidine kinase n=1 Tax=Nocardioides baculatus TaxID=2801337 RepID=A0ABS1LEW7_9ACTN|nr:PAS domain-containing sensor histidine kinase [Nocardioides baculatus]MBL0749968.1 PAS domain-containing protein [Nocardioides baculatus]
MGDPTLDTHVDRGRDELRLVRRLLDQLPALVAYWDADGRNVVANHAYVDYYGMDPADLRGMHISDLLGDELYARNLPYISGALAGREQIFDRTLVDRHGITHYMQGSYVPDMAGDVVRGFFALLTDVTPRVEAQRAMDQAESIARLGSWELDVSTDRVTWSRNLYEIVGLDPDDDAPRTLPVRIVHIHPDDEDRVLATVERAVETGLSYACHYRILTVGGHEREVVSTGRPVRGHDGRVTRINGTMQDVTEANAAARHLAQVNDELRRASELNADVLAMLGHDVRTPLTVVLANLEDLEHGWATLDDDQRRHRVSRARAASERLAALVERILSLAAIDGSTIAPVREDLDLAAEVAEVASESALPGHPVVEVVPDAPSTISFDRVHLRQVLTNLLTNAYRYGEEPVGISVSREADRVEVAVTDSGPGVAPDEVGSLFTRFARTGLRQLAAGGTGLGLYLAAQLAEANGATLTYRTDGTGGAHAFVLSIPLPVT